ncbi:MAG: hypothetical protein ACOYJY_02415 [Acutalibacteraceae bacterium]|jgi:hypothetical protein
MTTYKHESGRRARWSPWDKWLFVFAVWQAIATLLAVVTLGHLFAMPKPLAAGLVLAGTVGFWVVVILGKRQNRFLRDWFGYQWVQWIALSLLSVLLGVVLLIF